MIVKRLKLLFCWWILNFLGLLILHATTGFSMETVLFSCDFSVNTCGMENQHGSKAFWNREYLVIGGRRGYAMVTRGNEAKNHFTRLLTKFISTQGADKGCLKFRYFIDGRTPASIAVIKQGYVTEYVFATARKTGGGWEKANVDVNFLGDQAMFYFEADTRIQDYGSSLVAFTDLMITSKPCILRNIG